jgi:hypothetical protein
MQCGFKTPWHPSHTTGSYGNTGISGIDLPGVTSAPVGKTIRVASIREHGQALKDIRTPSRFSYAAKSISIPFSTTPMTSSNRGCFMYASSHLAFLLSRRSLPRKVRVMNFKRAGGIRSQSNSNSLSKRGTPPRLRSLSNCESSNAMIAQSCFS